MSRLIKQWIGKFEEAPVTVGMITAIVVALISGAFALAAVLIRESDSQTPTPPDVPTLTAVDPGGTASLPASTPAPRITALSLSAVADECRRQSFTEGSASVFSVAFEEAPCTGITLGWSVPQEGAYAGCYINLPPDLLPLSSYSYLVLRVTGATGSEQFQVGLIEAGDDPTKQHKPMERVPPEGANQPLRMSLDRFGDADTPLEVLNQLVFGVNYDVGAGLRDSSICVTDISFVDE